MTVLEVLTAASGYLERNGIESPRLNAEHLLAHVLGKKRLDLYMEFDRPLSDTERAPLRELIRDRGTGKPLQHLLGTAEFFGRSFLCDSRALVPRPETEQLVELALRLLRADGQTSPTVVDVGTGSGVIAITVALELPGAEVTATDLSATALTLARENAARHPGAERIVFENADLLPTGSSRFHLIAANLPYLPADTLPALQREVQFDPVSALDGGPDGLDPIRALIRTAPARLNPGGRIVLEIGHDQAGAVEGLLQENNFRDITPHPDYQGIQRFVAAAYG
ncbi:MAG TPA: peptide chain release factor N(5)-glutamine methyltransferase [Terrimicrobiaceae bacterium]|nr:peptide chain release factor N(5)-glutamine methyltransferase [Terrimicrobiaceae bacterium]